MNETLPATPPPPAAASADGRDGVSTEAAAKAETARMIEALDRLPDDALRDLAAKAQDILAAREAQRRAEAVAEIERLAKEHGLKVSVAGEPKRRRGRPRKPKGQGSHAGKQDAAAAGDAAGNGCR